ncbi:hypothetical protein [Zophobihabitans entericus]|uniref:Uncharacterized protein n=1 Tax=Zophobihabitans entericus TaxID=1635327 RepID=A0A6G9ICW4_9GAMM|nr:hypothetical protein [Zophobihabitans entericus]QIQ22076.1 hypothetical protein IPMB12_10495 [Zophobihabitans entericus]
MISVNTFYTVLVIFALSVPSLIVFMLRRHIVSSKKRYYAWLIIFFISVFGGHLLKTEVYIFGETEGSKEYSRFVTVYPTEITLPNGRVAEIAPRLGLSLDKALVINLSRKPMYLEMVVYGNASSKPGRQTLSAYQVSKVDNRIDYIFVEPPSSIKIKGDSSIRGWIHY